MRLQAGALRRSLGNLWWLALLEKKDQLAEAGKDERAENMPLRLLLAEVDVAGVPHQSTADCAPVKPSYDAPKKTSRNRGRLLYTVQDREGKKGNPGTTEWMQPVSLGRE